MRELPPLRRSLLAALALLLTITLCGGVARANVGWAVKAPMSAPRSGHTVTLLEDGSVLVVGGEEEGATTTTNVVRYAPETGAWTKVASMIEPHEGHTATLLGKGSKKGWVLVVGGLHGSAVIGAELYDPLNDVWKPTAPMNEPNRISHAATLLEDGRVLVAGGDQLGDVEIYSPDTDTWTSAKPMAEARYELTLTLLPNGRVLAVGGQDPVLGSTEAQKNTEIFDPVLGTWAPTKPMLFTHVSPTATLLPGGKVLILGSDEVDALGAAEMYDVIADTWSILPDQMSVPRSHAVATRLQDGRVLVTGGISQAYQAGSGSLASAELYDPALGTWSTLASMQHRRESHAATILKDGRVIVVGGSSLASVEVYTPTTINWSRGPALARQRHEFTATSLEDGRVLFAGGSFPPDSEIYLVDQASASTPTPMNFFRFGHSAARLDDGSVLVSGGVTLLDVKPPSDDPSDPGGEPTLLISDTAEIYTSSGEWVKTTSMSIPRSNHTMTLLSDHRVLAVGGLADVDAVLYGSAGSVLASAEIYDPAAKTWTPTSLSAIARSDHTATLLQNGQVLVSGNTTRNGHPINASELYDPRTNTWAPVVGASRPRREHTATLLDDGSVLFAGGITRGLSPSADAEIYDPRTSSWHAAESMLSTRAGHTATRLPDGRVLVTGGQNGFEQIPIETAEVYDPKTDLWSSAGSMLHARTHHTATPVVDGRVIVTGWLELEVEVFTPLPAGNPCSGAGQCQSALCTNKVCCATTCEEGLCGACAVAAGAAEDGTCKLFHDPCGQFVCNPELGTCFDGCVSVDQCSDGYACDPMGQCRPPAPTQSTRDFDDCAFRPRAPGGTAPAEIGSVILAALAMIGRRRRSSRIHLSRRKDFF